MSIKQFESYAPLVLRIGLGFVFIWFGFSGITNPSMWVGMVPEWTAVFGPAATLVVIHGIVELIGGIMLCAGWYVRPVGIILLLSLLQTLTILSFGPIMVRDIGLALALFSSILYGNDRE